MNSSQTQRVVDNILSTIKNVYKTCANDFHQHYLLKFNSSLSSKILYDKRVMNYDKKILTKFIDDCIMFRLKINIKPPLKSDIMYQLCSYVNPNLFTESLDSILEELIYSAIPSHLVDRLKQQLEIYDFDQAVISLILAKLDYSRV